MHGALNGNHQAVLGPPRRGTRMARHSFYRDPSPSDSQAVRPEPNRPARASNLDAIEIGPYRL